MILMPAWIVNSGIIWQGYFGIIWQDFGIIWQLLRTTYGVIVVSARSSR